MDSEGQVDLPQAPESATRQKHVKNGKSARPGRMRQPPIRCPECGSRRVWKDGVRRTNHGPVQRWLCRSCGFRFSESTADFEKKVDVLNQNMEQPNPRKNLLQTNVFQREFSGEPLVENLSFERRENIASHTSSKQTIIEKRLYAFPDYGRERRVSATENEAKNLVKVKPQLGKAGAGATRQTSADIKGKIIEFAWWLQKRGYKSARNRVNMVKRLADLGADLWNPESVKDVLARQTGWKDGYKMLMTYAYDNFLVMEGLSWQKPRYRQEEALPFIPTEEELDQLIAGVGKKVGTFLQGLKDTGADPGELAKLRWIDINKEAGTVNITPVKGHNPRVLRVSGEFIRRVTAFTKKSEYIFNYQSLKSGYPDAREHLARKLNNPRLLAITFTTFRHWKGTMEYHKTHDILHVKQLLGHKRIQNTMVYVNLEAAIFTDRNDEFHVAVAKDTEEACKLVKVGFEYVTGEYRDGGMIFRKRK